MSDRIDYNINLDVKFAPLFVVAPTTTVMLMMETPAIVPTGDER